MDGAQRELVSVLPKHIHSLGLILNMVFIRLLLTFLQVSYRRCLQNEDHAVLLFRVEDAEILIPDKIFNGAGHGLFRNAARQAVAAFPALWAGTMGENYYMLSREFAAMDASKEWRIMASATGKEKDFSASDGIADRIQRLISEVRREGQADGG